MAGSGGVVILVQNQFHRSGFSVASAGDINGDGFADLIIGAPYAAAANNTRPLAGNTYAVSGSAGRLAASIDMVTIACSAAGTRIATPAGRRGYPPDGAAS